jgi:hypothetical protein
MVESCALNLDVTNVLLEKEVDALNIIMVEKYAMNLDAVFAFNIVPINVYYIMVDSCAMNLVVIRGPEANCVLNVQTTVI